MNKKILLAMLTVMALLISAVAFAEETASAVQVGDHFTFGVYEQDNDLTNGIYFLMLYMVVCFDEEDTPKAEMSGEAK